MYYALLSISVNSHFVDSLYFHVFYVVFNICCDFSSRSLAFEKAYCEYRLNRIDEALRTIKSVANPDDRLRELHGQVVSAIR
jgi:hypothetical protein